jgi:hypothetical protein
MDPHDPGSWRGSEAASLLESFWSSVKRCTEYRYGINKAFITGVTPLSLDQYTSGFNIAHNVSFEPKFSTVCGLTRPDVQAALQLIHEDDEEKVKQDLNKLTYYANGYHFCSEQTVPNVFNTNTVLWYFNVSAYGDVGWIRRCWVLILSHLGDTRPLQPRH